MSIDTSELETLSANLGRASGAVVKGARGVVAKGALNIKNETREKVSTHPTWSRLAQTVTYEQVGLEAEVGYEDRGQGELAGIAELGSARHAPHPALIPAARDEAPKFEKAMGDLAVKALDL